MPIKEATIILGVISLYSNIRIKLLKHSNIWWKGNNKEYDTVFEIIKLWLSWRIARREKGNKIKKAKHIRKRRSLRRKEKWSENKRQKEKKQAKQY